MNHCPPDLIENVRSASRLMLRELGFMRTTLAATDYPPSSVHTIVEIGNHESLTAGELVELLGLEKSSVSRMVRKLVEAGEIEEIPHEQDARASDCDSPRRGKTPFETSMLSPRNRLSRPCLTCPAGNVRS